jgi:hypothetical protein
MPNPRPLALIGLASAVAAIAPTAATPFKFEGTPTLARPSVYAIAIRPETVWFCATAARDSHFVAYAFARRTRDWRTVDGARRCGAARRTFRYGYDSLPLEMSPGVRVESRIAPRDSEGKAARSTLRFIDTAGSLDLDLRPVLRPSRVAALLKPIGSHIDEDTTSISIGATALNDTLVWLGLAGGFPEGEGSFGGVYRIDRRIGAWNYILDSTLAGHTVTGLAQTRDWLWVGTEQPGEFGPFGRAGLRRFDLRTGAWRDYRPGNSPIPDALVSHVASDDRVVAVATAKGIAVIELRATRVPREIERWNTRYFVPAFAGDSLTIRLAPKAEAPSDSTEAAYVFAQEFGKPGRERLLFQQLRRVPTALTRDALDGFVARIPASTLANPALSPILMVMLESTPVQQRAVARAVRMLGRRTPTGVRASLQARFAALDTSGSRTDAALASMTDLATALLATGDSVGILWARRQLDKSQDAGAAPAGTPRSSTTIAAAASIVATTHDPKGLALMLMNVGVDPDLDKRLMEPLAIYDSPRSWQALISIVERRHAEIANSDDPDFYWRRALNLTRPTAFADSSTAARMKTYLRLGLTDTSRASRGAAFLALASVRPPGFGADLVRVLPDSQFGRQAYTTLVGLYGRSDAPRVGDRVSPEAIAWWRRVISNEQPSVVSRARGEKALRDWSRRPVKR